VRLGFKVSARTVAKYMRRPYAGKRVHFSHLVLMLADAICSRPRFAD
jgi:hypothetical protein